LTLPLTFVSLIPVAALVALTLAAMKREDPAAIVRAAGRHLAWLVGGLVALALAVQILVAIVQ